MPLAPWRSPLTQALDCNQSLAYSRYLQLATVRVDGRPANRTLVFRGFLEQTDQLKFAVDHRSQKVDQINYSSWAEACWYFAETREQFRIFGCLTLVGTDHPDPTLRQARQVIWENLSDNARLQFSWPHPGETRADATAFTPPAPEPGRCASRSTPLPNFNLLLLEPMQVDYLKLRGEPQNRWIYSFDHSHWSTQAVNP